MLDSHIRPVTVALPTLGCKANRYDSDVLARALIARGYVIVPPDQAADIYIVNTCTVTAGADAKSRKLLRRAVRTSAEATVIVTGCAASLRPEQLAEIGGVSAVVPLTEQPSIPDLLVRLRPPTVIARDQSLAPGLSASIERTRATVKVQDGCDRRCAYCAVTLARGNPRSRPQAEVLTELRDLAQGGIKEIVLTGIRLDAYGIDREGDSLAALLDATQALHIPRLRLSSLEPIGITPQLVESLAAHPTLCRHFHLCLQSGDDQVLRAMRRGYTGEQYREMISALRGAMPDATFTTDVIVGFPGETDEAFAHTCALVAEVGFIKLHVFKFSPRPLTEAATLSGQLAPSVKDARSQALMALERESFQAYALRQLGTRVSVLVERRGLHGDGLTPHYLRVCAPFTPAMEGEIVPVTVSGVGESCLFGKLRNEG
ncbi:MAG TPA: tRNA (N(6)-L-threonylcarbamoyladenosine(37)-C(2))-methylthiotransferase MtaB [Armatimonadota bacterium]|jgi:threonylcarbamoyladenosine tRNA methylthiotransferase MtaB